MTFFLAGFDPVGFLRAAIPFLSLLVGLVVIHEFGHFVAAKLFGIKVLEFGIGFPPRIKGLSWRRGETEYTINWLPIGGFVRLLGEEDPGDPRSLAAAPRWKRLTVLFAGVFMNLVVAVLLLTAGFMIPRDRSLSLAQISQVAAGSPAAEAQVTGEMRDGSAPVQGLQPGDIVTEVEGRDVKNTNELIYANRLNLGETQTWRINRQGSTLTAKVYARWHPPAGQGPTGIRVGAPQTCTGSDADGNPAGCQLLYPYTESVWYPPWEALPKGLQSLVDTVVLTKNELQVRFGGGGGGGTNSSEPAFTGPVGIANTTGELIKESGWRPLIEFTALLSLNLAIFNALPLPMLDGGRMFFVFVEILRGGRRIAPEKEALVHLTGFALMMVGVLVVTYFDIARIVS
ncbi:MAG: site-2 protease family protein [Chloroflexi bacterium]|nr:site-2 protease family protein [Chloroflexota bacterium]